MITQETVGRKNDAGKIRMDLLPPDAAMAIAAVFTYGAAKYEDWNWAKGMKASRVVAAMDRHMAAWNCGEELDVESGMPHLWHAGCCIMMLIGTSLRGTIVDDRERNERALSAVQYAFEHMNAPPAEDAPWAELGGAPVHDRVRGRCAPPAEVTMEAAMEAATTAYKDTPHHPWYGAKMSKGPLD